MTIPSSRRFASPILARFGLLLASAAALASPLAAQTAQLDPVRLRSHVDPEDDRDQFDELISTLRDGTDGENAKPIRVFTIAYGKAADFDTLEQIAQSTNAAAYDASNPATISKVFTAVVSNF